MPYRDGSAWPGAGDDDAADFLVDIIEPFLTDAKGSGGLGWISQSPDVGAGGGGSHPNYQRMFSRGGVGTEAPPYWFFQTSAKTLWHFTGSGVDITEQPYDQPGNPMNQPIDAVFTDPSGNQGTLGSLVTTTLVGPYDDYWLFGGDTGQYCHVVLKVSAREYRHFHIGMALPLDPDLHADTFYITNHSWGWLDPDDLRAGTQNTNNSNSEHQPYSAQHFLPFANDAQNNTAFGGQIRRAGMYVYSPLYGTENYDWWIMTGADDGLANTSTAGRAHNTAGNSPNGVTATVKNIGDINAGNDDVLFGSGFVTGYDKTIGTILFASDPTFTTDGVALIPIYIMLHSDFSSALRWAPVAQVPDVFRVNMRDLDAEQEITVGSATYTVFPLMNKDSANTLSGEGYSGFEGLAYLKNTADAT